jgi:hypothetical protein
MEICLQGRHCHLLKPQKKKIARRGGTAPRVRERLTEHDENVTADIERRVAAAVNEMAPSGGCL